MKIKNTPSSQLYYLYDQEADVFYLSQGKPSARDRSVESGDDVLVRTDTKGHVRGFTILNFSKRQSSKSMPIRLPIRADWALA